MLMLNSVAIYVRLSEEDKDKKNLTDNSESIQNQKSMLIDYCMERGWSIYNIYCDEDYSGADQNRPEWNHMINDCANKKVNVVLCKTQSRFSREMEMIEKYIHNKFVEWGVRFISLVDHADTDVVGNKKARQINGLINEWYLEDLSDNIRRTLNHKKRNGEWTGSFAPYGYNTNPENKNHLVVDPTAAKVVQEIFSMYKDGIGYLAIAKTLNEHGILSPTLYKRANGSKFRTNETRLTSRMWTDSTIARIVRREVYTGTLVQGFRKTISYKNKRTVAIPKDDWIRVEHAHEAIVDDDLWNAVQVRIKENTRQEKFSGRKNILTGKVFCAECGNSMWKMSYALSKGRYQYLKCKSTKTSTNLCSNNRSIRVDALENTVITEINKLLAEYYDPSEIEISDTNTSKDNKTHILISEKSEISAQLLKKEQHLQRLYQDRLEEIINESQFIAFNQKINSEIEVFRNRINTIDKELNEIASDIPLDSVSREEILSKYRHIEELTQEIVDEFIDNIFIDVLLEVENQRKVKIIWKV